MSDSLAHYGVLGMKWGVRKDGKPQGWQSDGNGRKSAYSAKQQRRGTSSKLVGGGSSSSYSTAKYMAKEIAIELLPLAAIASYMLALKGREALVRRQERKNKSDFKSVDDIPRKTKKTTPEEDRKAANPGYPASGRTMNCIFCSVTYDLRRRGYDVQAKPRKMGGPANEIETYYKDAKMTKHWSPDRYENFNNLKGDLEKQPVGARGSIGAFGIYGGHQMSYEVRSNGVFIIDPQNGKEMSIDDLEPGSVFGSPYKGYDRFDYLRTDDKELNIDAISIAVDAVKHDK